MSRIKFYYVYRAYNKTSEVFFEDQQDAVDYASNFTATTGIEIDPVMVFYKSQKTDKQQTQPVIPLPEECVFVPMADKLGIDINLAAKLYDAVVAKQQAGA